MMMLKRALLIVWAIPAGVLFAGLDEAAWIGESAEAPAPRFLRFTCPFDGEDEPLTLEVSADQRYVLLLDGQVVGRGPDNGDVKHWHSRRMTLAPGSGRHLLEAVVWSLDVAYENGRTVDRPVNDRPYSHLTWRTGFALAADGVYDARLTTGSVAGGAVDADAPDRTWCRRLGI